MEQIPYLTVGGGGGGSYRGTVGQNATKVRQHVILPILILNILASL